METAGAGSVLKTFRVIFYGAIFAGLWMPLAADAADTNSAPDMSDLSLEQLINIKVVSVSKKETSLESSPAAVTVITQDDIRRLGIESIPEALRLVPGMDVAQINSHEWAVSARGFNDEYANKLLVLVDGRAAYDPAFGGVYWDVQDIPMEDIDRIEVIRGPGGTLWGENAVDGVVNIITKSAKDTQGLLASVGGGNEDQPYVMVRYGGQLTTNLFYRAYLKYFNGASFEQSDHSDAADGWDSFRTGGRLDWEPKAENQFTLQGDYYVSRLGENMDVSSPAPPFYQSLNVGDNENGGNVLARWTHEISDTSQLSIQAYDEYVSQEETSASERQNTFDLDAQHRFALGDWNDIVWGLGYRYMSFFFPEDSFLEMNPGTRNDQLFSGFVQDEITVVPNYVHFTAGTKLEHNDFSGFEYEPSARLTWTPTTKQTVWAAVSRAVRTPTIFDLDGTLTEPDVGTPVEIMINPNSGLKSESLVAYELGYRVQPVKRLSFDTTAFYNGYHDLLIYVPGAFVFPVQQILTENGGRGYAFGGEVSAQWQPLDYWRVVASYSLFKQDLHPSADLSQSAPVEQAQLRTYLDITRSLEINAMASYVDSVTTLNIAQTTVIPSYVRLDVGVIWRPTKSVEMGIWGQNLLQAQHQEFTSDTETYAVNIPRSVLAKITFRF